MASGEAKRANAAERELAARELARRRLMPFVRRMVPKYTPGWVHMDIARRLEKFLQDVLDQKSPRLMLQLPPRAGKSELVSKNFAAWVLGKHPDLEVIGSSYALDLQLGFSRWIRNTLRSKEFQLLFPKTKLDPEQQNAQGWKTSADGGFLPAGVGGPITGRGAHIFIIDDPVKNAEEANSQTTRESIWQWYTTTAYTRLAPGGGMLVVQTRWHMDDLSGRLEQAMADGTGDNWVIIRYPAIAVEDERHRKKGEALHPERFNLRALERIQRAVGPEVWQSLYQQNPVAEDGDYFTRDMFGRVYKTLPDNVRYVAGWDFAIGQKERNDWTVGFICAIDDKGDLYVIHRYRVRADSMAIIELMLDSHERWPQFATAAERGHISMALGPFLDMRIRERKQFTYNVTEFNPGKRDKELRARPIQGRMRQGKVFWPDPTTHPWVAEVMAEFLQFPKGRNDDQVDSFAWVGQLLEQVPPPPPVKPSSKPKGWREKLAKRLGSRSGTVSHMAA